MEQYYLLAWSGGKDCSFALYEFLKQESSPVRLFATVTHDYDRVSMHGVRTELIKVQAEALNLPLEILRIPKKCSNQLYETMMEKTLAEHKAKGCQGVIFGDIFLAEIRKYRERNIAKAAMKAIFPLWGKSTEEISKSFIKEGFKAVITCVDAQLLDKSFAGKVYDQSFLLDLPPGIDPCGENGEFHTFTYGGPLFQKFVPFKKGEIILREKRFYYCDLKLKR